YIVPVDNPASSCRQGHLARTQKTKFDKGCRQTPPWLSTDTPLAVDSHCQAEISASWKALPVDSNTLAVDMHSQGGSPGSCHLGGHMSSSYKYHPLSFLSSHSTHPRHPRRKAMLEEKREEKEWPSRGSAFSSTRRDFGICV
ncbi:hypothetical protein Taro_055111, partial [Colocasia esculenta]|nr:hypothetical protein [Colocasia esculenta]